MKKIILSISFIVYLFFLFPYSITMANEEAPYKVVHKNEVYEVRYYSDRLVVQVINKNDSNGFRKLFNYISGANASKEKIKMTIPVTQTKKNNKTYMQFYLPLWHFQVVSTRHRLAEHIRPTFSDSYLSLTPCFLRGQVIVAKQNVASQDHGVLHF